jgi:hypothetical protein
VRKDSIPVEGPSQAVRRLAIRKGAALVLALTACQTVPPPRELPKGDPRPGALLARWSASVADREALRGIARLSVDAADAGAEGPLRVRSKQRIALARPARLRVEVQGLLGTTLAVLAVDGGEYAFFEAEGRHFEAGPVHDYLLWEIVRLDLSPAQAVEVMLGAPVLAPDEAVTGAFEVAGGVTRIRLGPGRSPRARELDLDADARLLRLAQWEGGDAPAWVASFDEYAPVAGAEFAHRVTLTTRSGARAVVSLSRVELNPPLSPDIFRLDRIGPMAAPAGEGG